MSDQTDAYGLGHKAVTNFDNYNLRQMLQTEQERHRMTQARLRTALHLLKTLIPDAEFENAMTATLYDAWRVQDDVA